MLQPVNAATPPTAGRGVALVHTRVAPAGVVMVNVTELVLVVTVLPAASCTLTTGCAPNAALLAAPVGWVVKPSLAAGPAVTVKLALAAPVRTPSAAVRV